MPCKALALTILTGLLTASCASTPPSPSPTAPLPPPEACLAPCPPLPSLPAPSLPSPPPIGLHHDQPGPQLRPPAGLQPGSLPESAVVIWLHHLIDAAGACRRQHDACRASHPGQPASR